MQRRPRCSDPAVTRPPQAFSGSTVCWAATVQRATELEERPRAGETDVAVLRGPAASRGATTLGALQRPTTLLIAGLGVVLTLVACAIARRREIDRNQDLFDRRAAVLAGSIAR